MNRINWVDNLKGFILILVCLSHFKMPWIIVNMSSFFRMTTFFFLSGFLFSDRRYPTVFSYTKSKSHSLLFPYVYLSVCFSIIDPSVIRELLEIKENLVYFYLYRLVLNFNTILWGMSSDASFALWFVLTLFMVCIMFFIIHYFIHVKLGLKDRVYRFLFFCYAFVHLLLAWYFYKKNIRTPFNIPSYCSATFFFTIGVILKPAINRYCYFNKKLSLCKNFALIIPIFCFSFYLGHKNGNIWINHNQLGDSFFLLVSSSFLGISSIIALFVTLSRISGRFSIIIGGVLRNIARNALVILAVHSYVYCVCREFCTYYSLIYSPYYSTIFLILCLLFAIPLFRTKLYFLIGKTKTTLWESLSIK